MLRSIRVENFRSCKKTSITKLGSIAALIGRNGAGKTNVLRAINWLARTATSNEYALSEFDPRAESENPIVIEIDFDALGATYKYCLTRGLRNKLVEDNSRSSVLLTEELTEKLDGMHKTIFERTGEEVTSPHLADRVRVGPISGAFSSLHSVLPKESLLLEKIQPVHVFLSSIRYYPIDEPCAADHVLEPPGFAQEKDYQSWLAKYRETADPGDSVTMRLIHMSIHDVEKFSQLKQILGPSALGIIDDITIRSFPFLDNAQDSVKSKKSFFHIVRFTPSQRSVSGRGTDTYADLSTGTRRILRILTSLLFDKSSVMLLEHPEDGIHTALVKKLIAAMKICPADSQIILTSHSATILNELKPADIRIVTMKNGETSAHGLSAKQIKAAADFITEQGTVAEFLELASEE